jgi:diacylglycerol kinase family enzyme
VVIRNPVSGRQFGSQRRAAQLVRELRGRGFSIDDTTGPGDATGIARAACKAGADYAVIVGGDGTLLDAVQGLAPHVRIAIFPTGTVNLFARGLKIPFEVEPWLRMLESGTTRLTYMGLCNGRPFTSCASVGLDSETVAQVNPRLKRAVQEVAYGLRAFELYFRWVTPQFQVQIDGEVVHEPLQGVLIGKGPYFGGPNVIFPDADLSRPELQVALLVGTHKRILWKYVGGMLTGRLPLMRGPVYRTCRTVSIQTDPPIHVELDGDAAGSTPVTISVDAVARSFVAPPAPHPGGSFA